MLSRLKLVLEQDEFAALYQMARAELRTPSEQARYMLRQELQRTGLLPAETPETVKANFQAESHAKAT
jgi:hypothetical protein